MNLKQFLEVVGGDESDIIEYSGKKATEAVKKNAYALQYVNKRIFTSESVEVKTVKIKTASGKIVDGELV